MTKRLALKKKVSKKEIMPEIMQFTFEAASR